MRDHLRFCLLLACCSMGLARANISLAEQNPVMTLHTSKGELHIELFAARAPENVANILSLVQSDYYKPGIEVEVHKNFRIIVSRQGDQGGDKLPYRVKDEFDAGGEFDHAGIVAMMPSAPDDNGSRFMITLTPTPHLKHTHSVIGRVIKGLDRIRALDAMKRQADGSFSITGLSTKHAGKKPSGFYKIVPWTKKHLAKRALPLAQKFANAVAGVEGWGIARDPKITDYTQRGSQFQFSVELTFDGYKPAKMLMLAHRQQDVLEWKHAQIRRPVPLVEKPVVKDVSAN